MSTYECKICDYTCKRVAQINTHRLSKNHLNKRELFKEKLKKNSKKELLEKYETDDIEEIILSLELIKHEVTKEKNKKIEVETEELPKFVKKSKTGTVIFAESPTKNKKDGEFKDKFIGFLDKMHNLLRGAAVTGDAAFDDIIYTLMLCCLEEKCEELGLNEYQKESMYAIGKDIFESDYKDKVIKISDLIKDAAKLINSEFASSIEMCGEILNLHPKTKGLIKENNFINCTDKKIIYKLFTNAIEFNKENKIFERFDIVGLGYEYFSTKHGGNGGTSKEMGQYFTERPLMNRCFQLIDEADIIELKIDDNCIIGDEFCATFGFPLALKSFLEEKFKIVVRDENMFGVEYHERLSRFAKMNAMFSLKVFDNVIRGDSFITNVFPHLDISVHNVPFGKSMTPQIIKETYEAFYSKNEGKNLPKVDEYLPFCKKKIDAILASQVVLYKTKKMGLLIIKDGEETSSKENRSYRKWFCENCIVKKIMKIPSGAFTCTGTKTVCIYFIKKEKKMTENIQFLQLSDDGNKITEICNVSITDLKSNNYSWDPNVYIRDEEYEKLFKNSVCEFKKLGDLFYLNGSGKTNSKDITNTGEYPFYSASCSNPSGSHKQYDFDSIDGQDYLLIVKSGGSAKKPVSDNYEIGKVFLVGGKCAANVAVFQLLNKNNCNTKYIYYYLSKIQSKIQELAKYAVNNGNIDMGELMNLIIPIPELEIQERNVKMLDELEKQKRILEERKKGIPKQMKIYFDIKQKQYKDEIKHEKLGDLFYFKNGNYNSKDMDNVGHIPFYSCISENPAGFHSRENNDYEKYLLIVASGGSEKNPYGENVGLGKCYYVEGKTACRAGVFSLVPKDANNIKYIYHYLKNFKNIIVEKAKFTTNLGTINSEDLQEIIIPIPELEIQKKMIIMSDNLEQQKNEIIKEIESINNLMKEALEVSYK